MTFDRPLFLLLFLVLPPALWMLARHSRAPVPVSSRRLALAVRIVVLFLLTLTLAGPHVVKHSHDLTTLFVLDVSRSVRPEQRAAGLHYIQKAMDGKRNGDSAGIVTFGRTANVDDAPSDTLDTVETLHPTVASDATDLAGALRLAAGAFPEGTGKKIVLLSDGNQNAGGDAADEIASLRAQGVRVDVAPTALDRDAGAPEAAVDDVTLPSHARADSPFPVRVSVSSTTPQTAVLQLTRDGQPFARQNVKLVPGSNVFTFSDRVERGGFHRYDVKLAAPSDTVAENNAGYGFVSVQGRPRVLYVTDSTGPLPTALSAQGMDVEQAAPGAVPASVSVLASYDAVLLSGVTADELGPGPMDALRLSCRDFGVGLGLIGGPEGFGAGGYGGTPIEEASPVTMRPRATRKLPAAAIVVVLDASGSMAATEDGVQKVQLGAQAAVNLMGALQPGDQIAVTSVTETTTLVLPLSDSSKVGLAQGAIQSVAAGGGGIYCRQALEDAYHILLENHAPLRHVILCADTSDSEQQDECLQMAAEMKAKGITTTVCGIGKATDHDVPFQRGLAQAGGGQSFIVEQAEDLPHLFQRDLQSVQQTWFVEKPTRLVSASGDDLLSGLDMGTAPPLLGYNLVTAKSGTLIGLSSPDGDPVLAHGRYGLGRTFAFAGDDRARWATDWLAWPAFPRFWAQSVRWALRSSANTDYQASANTVNGRGHLSVEMLHGANGSMLTASVVAPDLSVHAVPLAQMGPGSYEGTFPIEQTGAYLASVRPALSSGAANSAFLPTQTVGLVVPYSPEYRTLGANLPLLTQIAEGTGGKVQPDPAQIFRDAPLWTAGILDLTPLLLTLCALCWVGDIAIRRLGLRLPSYKQASPTLQGLGQETEERAAFPPLQGSMEDNRAGGNRSPHPKPGKLGGPSPGVLSRRAVPADEQDDNPFPFVASLKNRKERDD